MAKLEEFEEKEIDLEKCKTHEFKVHILFQSGCTTTCNMVTKTAIDAIKELCKTEQIDGLHNIQDVYVTHIQGFKE